VKYCKDIIFPGVYYIRVIFGVWDALALMCSHLSSVVVYQHVQTGLGCR
jgi:hypothetical protein